MRNISQWTIIAILSVTIASCAESDRSGTSELTPMDVNQHNVSTTIDHFVALGSPRQATSLALSYYIANKANFDNKRYISVLDMSQSSSEKRFYLIDLAKMNIQRYLVAHGSGSDTDHDGIAERFSNRPKSKASSLGYYQVSEPYMGKYGLSVRMDGLSETNDNARRRAIVIHGANYVNPKADKIGRSWGCPALDINLSSKVINKIKKGSLLFMYSPAYEKYL